MRALKVLVVVMAVMIVAGVIVLGVTIYRRVTNPHPTATVASAMTADVPIKLPATLDEPQGTSIVQATASGDRIVLLLHGGGPDRVLVLDAHDGSVTARTSLAH